MSMSSPTTPAPPAESAAAGAERPTLRGIIRRYRLAAAVVGVILVVLVAMIVVAGVSSSRSIALRDSAMCSSWTSADRAQQAAYAQLYVNEHPPAAGGTLDANMVASALTAACTHAAYLGEADDVSLVAALNHAF